MKALGDEVGPLAKKPWTNGEDGIHDTWGISWGYNGTCIICINIYIHMYIYIYILYMSIYIYRYIAYICMYMYIYI
jgi:hypothetical protein